jgi:hypothetical protein
MIHQRELRPRVWRWRLRALTPVGRGLRRPGRSLRRSLIFCEFGVLKSDCWTPHILLPLFQKEAGRRPCRRRCCWRSCPSLFDGMTMNAGSCRGSSGPCALWASTQNFSESPSKLKKRRAHTQPGCANTKHKSKDVVWQNEPNFCQYYQWHSRALSPDGSLAWALDRRVGHRLLSQVQAAVLPSGLVDMRFSRAS